MNKIVFILVGISLIIQFSHCKNDKQANQETSANSTSESSQSNDNADPLIIQLPKEYYRPPGLKPLNLVQMHEFGTRNPDSLRNLPIKNKHGEDVSRAILEDPEKPVFMQMYVDENGSVVQAVVFELNDTIKNLMMNIRKTSK